MPPSLLRRMSPPRRTLSLLVHQKKGKVRRRLLPPTLKIANSTPTKSPSSPTQASPTSATKMVPTTPKTPPCPQQASPPDQASDPALRRVIVDLSGPVGAPPREIPPQKEQEQAKKKSYADLLKGDQDNAPPKRVKTVVNRPKPEEDVLEAISQATPIQVKKATTTMWIETNGALYDKVYTNEKIIDAIFKENQNAAWSYLLLEFVQASTKRASATSSCPLPRVT
ncbi:hypothetical protein Ae201684P_018225 [Aphanomyces euteiches]|nr:hypothetical protein Ae201684P_018225 [Aphanomyces euteiches]